MARLPLVERQMLRKRKIITLYLNWLNVLHVVEWFFKLLESVVREDITNNSLRRHLYMLDVFVNRQIVHELVYEDENKCIKQLRLSRQAFANLCVLLETRGGLRAYKYVQVDEQVALFLHILAHHIKNRVIKFQFMRSGETVSKYFHNVMHSIIRMHRDLLKKPEPISKDSTDEKWKWFKSCLGALGGTYIRVRVPVTERPRYRTRNGDVATNVLGVCSPDMQFVYVLPGWEGSADSGRVLRDAITRKNGLQVSNGQYYLVDGGYNNDPGFLAPFRGQRSVWSEGHQPSGPQEYFNMKHSSARDVINRCFDSIKNRWAVLRSPSFYPIKTQNRIVLACCLLHNFIRREMPDEIQAMPNEENDEGQENSEDEEENIEDSTSNIEPSEEWATWRENLAHDMYTEWIECRTTD